MATLPSFRLLREAIEARLHEAIDARVPAPYRPLLLRQSLIVIACVAQNLCVREEDYPLDVVEALNQLFADEIRQFRTIEADLTAHYLGLGFTVAEADSLIIEQHLWPDYLL